MWGSKSWLESVAEDKHRARVVLGVLVGGCVLGMGIATVDLALRGSALRWLVAGVGLVSGVLVFVSMLWAGKRRSESSRGRSRRSSFVPYALAVGAIGVVLDQARPTVEVGALAVGIGYLVGLLVFARVIVVRERRVV